MDYKEVLDCMICDCEDGLNTNDETYREYIRRREEELGMCPEPIDLYSNTELEEYLYELGYFN